MNKFRSRRPLNGMKNNGTIHQNNIHRNGLSRNHINKNPHNLERIVEKYKNLAKEALSVGDKILYENYLQHSDHFTRILSELSPSKDKETFKEKTVNTVSQNIINEQN